MKWIARISLVVAAVAAAGFGLTYWLVEGEAAGHAREHLTVAIVAGLVGAFIAFWGHPLGSARLVARALLALSFLYAAAVQLGEGVTTYRYEDAHGPFDDLATTSLIAVGVAAVAWALVILWQRTARPTGAMLMR
jgi:hypothetical protein